MLIINLQGSEAFQIRTKPLLIKLYIFSSCILLC